MTRTGAHFKMANFGDITTAGRITFHNDLALTSAEVSINELPAGVSIPFVHAHQQNEEIYLVLAGKGRFYIDGEEFDVGAGNILRVDPAAARCLKADAASSLRYACIQAKADSLSQFTETDGVPVDVKPSWLK